MKTFPSQVKFIHPWRTYQQRVLDELGEHLKDDHLHVVAPPGSGKTVLGLEVAIRLNRPTLILAPTLAIRNQWILRFCELFLSSQEQPKWISRNIRKPAFLTVTTYQGLHAACRNQPVELDEESLDEESDEAKKLQEDPVDRTSEVIHDLRKVGVGTIIVDEAHHLKNVWWTTLTKIKDELRPTIVGLTATPPYDVSYAEWNRYVELNGPVDTEISVPELIKAGDLCPHQDYAVLSSPTADELAKIQEHHSAMQELHGDLIEDKDLQDAILGLPVIQESDRFHEWIYTNFEFYASALVYLNATGHKITKDQLHIVADGNIEVPNVTNEYLETLLTYYLFKAPEAFKGCHEHQEDLLSKLKRRGAVEKKTICLGPSVKLHKLLSSSLGKLESIAQIVESERNNLGARLRMVVLTDYIRKEYLYKRDVSAAMPAKMGVLPIFEYLRRNGAGDMLRMGVLSGSVVIFPRAAMEMFQKAAAEVGIQNVSVKPLPYDDSYLHLEATDAIRHHVVHLFTKVFESGGIQVVIGTKSLLGEGWDAPTINSLILASFVGSHVLSNQMRGRAIRRNPSDPEKVSNIWHLVCIDHFDPDGGDDIRVLKRRFKGFVGVSRNGEPVISNGYQRLGLPDRFGGVYDLKQFNEGSYRDASDREGLSKRWNEGLESGDSLIEELKVPFEDLRSPKELKAFYLSKTIRNLIYTLGCGVSYYYLKIFEALGRNQQSLDIYTLIKVLAAATVVCAVLFGSRAIHILTLLWKFRDISSDIAGIGQVLLRTLASNDSFNTDEKDLEVTTVVNESGAVSCRLKGAKAYERSLFIKCMMEVVGPVDNPRYILVRKSTALRFLHQKDYHAIPEVLSRNRNKAEDFAREWRRSVGRCSIHYTRHPKGRRLLVKARVGNLASQVSGKPQPVKVWQ